MEGTRAMSKLNAHVFVISWPDVRDNVIAICEALGELNCRKTILDKSRTLPDTLSSWECVDISDEHYFGMQMEVAFRMFDGDIFIGIAGDAVCGDWKNLVETCVERFETVPYIGVWSPEIDNTGWSTERVSIGQIEQSELHVVCQTDAIVWAMRPQIVDRLRRMDFQINNFGWGVDWAAIVIAYSQGGVAVRDKKVAIHHPIGKSYSAGQAESQMVVFLDQLDPHERALLAMLNRSVGINFKIRLPSPTS